MRIFISLIMAYMFSVLFLKIQIYSLGILMALVIAGAIFLDAKRFVLFWLIFAAVSNKIEMPGFGITSYGLMNAIFLPCLILKTFIDYKREFSKFPIWKPYSLFLLVVFVSIWYSPEPYLMGVRKYCNFVIPFLFSILMVSTIKDYVLLKRYLKITLISVAIMGIIGTVMFYLNKWIVYTNVPRATGVLGWPNDYALFLNISLAVALSFAIWEKEIKQKFFYYIISLIILVSVIPTFSKGGYIGVAVIFLFVSIFSSAKKKNIKPVVFVLAMLLLAIGIICFKYSNIIHYRLSSQSSFLTRIKIWKSVMPEFWKHPIVGNGFRSSLKMVSLLSPYKDLTSTHNLYLRLLLETGIIGLFSFLIAYLSMLRYVLRIFIGSTDKVIIALSIGFISFFISTFIYSFAGNAFLTPMINLYVWFYFSFLICFSKLEKQEGCI